MDDDERVLINAACGRPLHWHVVLGYRPSPLLPYRMCAVFLAISGALGWVGGIAGLVIGAILGGFLAAIVYIGDAR